MLTRVTAPTLDVLEQLLATSDPTWGLLLIKATALMSIVQLPELMRMTDVAARAVRMPFTFYFAASLIFLAITLVSMAVIAWLERRAR